MRRLKKKIFLGIFGGTVLLLGAVRLAFPEARARVMRFGNMVAYVILPDLERAQRLLRSLSHGG